MIGHDGIATVWCLRTGEMLHEQELKPFNMVTSLARSLDQSEWIVGPTGEVPTSIAVCRLQTDHSLTVTFKLPRSHTAAVNALCCFRDNDAWTVASAGVDRHIILQGFTLESGGRPTSCIELTGHEGAVRALCYLPNRAQGSSDAWLASGSVDTTVTKEVTP